jgi:hypothetical protein
VVESDDFHLCRFLVYAAKMTVRHAMVSIVGNDYGKFLRMTQKTEQKLSSIVISVTQVVRM